MRKSPFTALLGALALYMFPAVLSLAALTPDPAAAVAVSHPSSCLERFAEVVTIRNDFGPFQYTNNTQVGKVGFDAFGSIWRPNSINGKASRSSIIVTVDLKGCWAGGRVVGGSANPVDNSRSAFAAIVLSGRRAMSIDFDVEWVDVFSVSNAIESVLPLDQFRLRHVFFKEIRGDCITLGKVVRQLVIRDSLIDGCSHLINGFADSRIMNTQMVIRNSLIRLRGDTTNTPQETARLVARSGPKVALVNNIFLLENRIPLIETLTVGARLGECRGNIVVLGNGGAVTGSLPPCFRIVKNQAVWAAQKNAWLEARDQRMRYSEARLNPSQVKDPKDASRRRELSPNEDADEEARANGSSDVTALSDLPLNGGENLSSIGVGAGVRTLSAPLPGAQWSDGTTWNDNTGWL
jgi:hypothetical protein